MGRTILQLRLASFGECGQLHENRRVGYHDRLLRDGLRYAWPVCAERIGDADRGRGTGVRCGEELGRFGSVVQEETESESAKGS